LKSELERLLAVALNTLAGSLLREAVDPASIQVERARDASHGDYASNIALRLAKSVGRAPREIAQAIVAALPPSPMVARAEVAGAGFINFYLPGDAHGAVLQQVLERGERFGHSSVGGGERVILEFVSANPTGPLHVGHGRQAAYGASLGNLLRVTGHSVHREYYINDSGRQMDILAVSTWLRYLELAARRRCRFRRTAIAATTCMPSPRSCSSAAGPRAAATGRRGAGAAAAGCAGRRQGTAHRRADRAHARAARR
jgi:arginyl-tRNA synthetase